jgi:hypothetical protein
MSGGIVNGDDLKPMQGPLFLRPENHITSEKQRSSVQMTSRTGTGAVFTSPTPQNEILVGTVDGGHHHEPNLLDFQRVDTEDGRTDIFATGHHDYNQGFEIRANFPAHVPNQSI